MEHNGLLKLLEGTRKERRSEFYNGTGTANLTGTIQAVLKHLTEKLTA